MLYPNTSLQLPSNEKFYPNTSSHMPSSSSLQLKDGQRMVTKQEFYPNMEQTGQVINPLYTNTGKDLISGEPIHSLSQTLMPSSENVGLLSAKLKQSILRRSGYSAQGGAAKLLIHFYNKGTGRYDELQKLTGYSEGGLAKLMMLVRAKGLIQRKAFQQFVPSQQALQLMQEAELK